MVSPHHRPEGSQLFYAEIRHYQRRRARQGHGRLPPTATVDGETVYPYEAAKLEYYRVGDLNSTVSGTRDFQQAGGLSLCNSRARFWFSIDGEDSENRDLHRPAKSGGGAEKAGERPEESGHLQRRGAYFRPDHRPEPDAGAGTSGQQHPCDRFRHLHRDRQRHGGRAEHQLHQGRVCLWNLDQWGTSAFGTVETVSLSSTVNNGVASYPITISADNHGWQPPGQ